MITAILVLTCFQVFFLFCGIAVLAQIKDILIGYKKELLDAVNAYVSSPTHPYNTNLKEPPYGRD